MGADYSFYVKIIETHARTFLTLNILAIGRVYEFALRPQKSLIAHPNVEVAKG